MEAQKPIVKKGTRLQVDGRLVEVRTIWPSAVHCVSLGDERRFRYFVSFTLIEKVVANRED